MSRLTLTSQNRQHLSNVEKTLNTFTLPSPQNTSVPEKTKKLQTPHPMTFIYQNKYYEHSCLFVRCLPD